MTLATVHAAAQPFNADFYVAAATVIPVLFLAAAITGKAYPFLARVAVVLRQQADEPPRAMNLADVAKWLGALLGSWLSVLAIVYSGAGEILALDVLYRRHATPPAGPAVLWSVIVLTAAVVAEPLITLTLAGKPRGTGDEPSGHRKPPGADNRGSEESSA
jgi:hypothetical protein